MPYVRHARFRGARQLYSAEEAGEQRQRLAVGGVCGGKGADRGERRTVLLGRTQSLTPRTRGRRDVGESALHEVRLWSSRSEVTSVCGHSARTDLCEGRTAMLVPTAIVVLVRASPKMTPDPLEFAWRRICSVWVIRPRARGRQGRSFPFAPVFLRVVTRGLSTGG